MQIGLDTQTFNSCLDSSKYKQVVKSEIEQGYDHGFRSTPSFMLNGKPLIGPPSYEQLSTLIDELLETNNNGQ
jgi:protein-disulfide isomerase